MYAKYFPSGREPQDQMFGRVNQQLCEPGSVICTYHDRGVNRSTRIVSVEEAILQAVKELTRFSVRDIARQYIVSLSTV